MPRLPRPRPIRCVMGASLGSRAVHVMAPRWSPTCTVVGAVGAAVGYAAISMVTVAGLLLARRGVGLRL